MAREVELVEDPEYDPAKLEMAGNVAHTPVRRIAVGEFVEVRGGVWLSEAQETPRPLAPPQVRRATYAGDVDTLLEGPGAYRRRGQLRLGVVDLDTGAFIDPHAYDDVDDLIDDLFTGEPVSDDEVAPASRTPWCVPGPTGSGFLGSCA